MTFHTYSNLILLLTIDLLKSSILGCWLDTYIYLYFLYLLYLLEIVGNQISVCFISFYLGISLSGKRYCTLSLETVAGGKMLKGEIVSKDAKKGHN